MTFLRPLFTVSTALLVAATIAQTANAAVVATSGTVVAEPTPFPPSSDSEIFAFDEQQGVAFVATQSLDFGSIAPETFVNSHYLQYDPASPTGSLGTGSVTFDGPILGVITSTANLTADLNPDVSGTSDSYFGLESLLGAYPAGDTPSERGLGSPQDDLNITLGSNTLVINSLGVPSAGSLDGIRVLTAIPEPTGVLLLAIGALGILGFCSQGRRRHRSVK